MFTGGDLSCHIWEKGNIDRSSLREKLAHTVHHGLLDYWMEKSIVPCLRQASTSLPAANCTLLHNLLKIGVDCKCLAYQAATFSLPTRRSVDLIADHIISIMNQQGLSLNVAALISRTDDSGVEVEVTEARIEGPSIKDILLPRYVAVLARNENPITEFQPQTRIAPKTANRKFFKNARRFPKVPENTLKNDFPIPRRVSNRKKI